MTRDTLRSSDEITAARLQEQESPSSGLQQREYEALNVDSVARKLAGGAPTAAAQFKTKLFIFEDTTKLDIIYEIRLRSICMRSHGYEDINLVFSASSRTKLGGTVSSSTFKHFKKHEIKSLLVHRCQTPSCIFAQHYGCQIKLDF